MVSITVGGKEYPLALTVQAFSDISDLCPGKDFDRINEINQLPTGELAKVSIKILAALSNGAEEQRAFGDPAYEKQPLKKKGKSRKIRFNRAWFLFYGRMLNMSKQEILCTSYAEMGDMISCFSIFNGAEPKKIKEPCSMDGLLKLR